ncbi:MAG: SMC family ATPase [Actinomycetota bacterium]|nr:SMC family ATPase [Actinomycetota bacterium]
MRLKTLQLENFRCFAAVNLDLDGMGLIGVRGRNGVGKSTLFEAIYFALYGQRHGLPARRDGAGADERLRVYVELDFDAHKVEVERTEDDARLTVDGRPEANGRERTTAEVSRLLGLSRQQFDSTFYARQKEIQSFAAARSRRPAIERLLGLTQLRRATELAQEQAKQQLVVVQTLQEEAANVEEAKRILSERREQAKQNAPLVQAAKQRRDELQTQREEAWERLKEAQDRATQAEQARSAQRLAAREHEAARQQHQAAEKALHAADRAVAEIERLAPVAGRVAELQARVSEFELREQAHEQYLSVREARADVQRKRAALIDELSGLPEPETSAEQLRASADQLRARRDVLTQELLESTERVAALTRQHDEAKRHQQVRARLEQLDRKLAKLPAVQQQEEQARDAQAELEGERAEIKRRLEDERAHRDEVERDGPNAECPRCRRLYGKSFKDILAGFEAAIGRLEERGTALEQATRATRKSHKRLVARLHELQRLEGERASLPVLDPETSADVGETERRLAEAEQRHRGLLADLKSLTSELAALEGRLRVAVRQEGARQVVIDRLGQLSLEEDLLSKQLDDMRVEDYDRDAHQQAVRNHTDALQAAQRSAELRQEADGRELAQRRCSAYEKAVQEAAEKLSAATTRLEAHESDEERLEDVQQRVKELNEQISEAEDELRKAEHRATSENQEVQAAEAAVKRAQSDRRKVRAAKREHRYAEATAKGLAQYTARVQRDAVPTLEKDTAEFLARLTANRYTDVLLDESGGLEIFDDGQPRPLKRFSGGEQDLANLCLRLALSRTFANQRTIAPGLIILDEVFGSQDLDRRRALLEHFRELNKVFSQVFIVSHFDDVADACDIQIQVQRRGKICTAELLP